MTFRLPRRTFLRGLGAGIALPALDAMMDDRGHFFSSTAHAQATPPPARMVIFTFANGAMMDRFTPLTAGAGFALTPCLQPFAGREQEITVVTGLGALPEIQDIYSAFDVNHHPLCASIFLTGGMRPHLESIAQPDGQQGITQRVRSPAGPSVDAVAAAAFYGQTRFTNLTVYAALDPDRTSPNTQYTWDGVDTPGAVQYDVTTLFNSLFGDLGSDPAVVELRARRRSILDAVRGGASALQLRLGAADRHRLDEHLTAIRDLELRSLAIENCEAPAVPDPGLMDRDLIRERVEVMLQLSAMALKCDLTRVLVFSLGRTSLSVPFTWLNPTRADGTPVDDHTISHWESDDAVMADNYEAITTWKVSQFARMLEIFETVQDGDGTLVDHSAIVCSSEFSDGGRHVPDMYPVLCAGRLGGMTGGRHLTFPCTPSQRVTGMHPNDSLWGTGGFTPHANLWLSQLHAVGVDAGSFGMSTGALSGLWGG